MIEIVPENYYVGIWFLASNKGMDWMAIAWRTAAGESEFAYRFRYYADPEERDGFNPFDERDRKSWWKGSWNGKAETEVIAILDEVVIDLVKRGFCGTRLPWKVREMTHKNLCQGDGVAFQKLVLGLPWTHMTTEEGYARKTSDVGGGGIPS